MGAITVVFAPVDTHQIPARSASKSPDQQGSSRSASSQPFDAARLTPGDGHIGFVQYRRTYFPQYTPKLAPTGGAHSTRTRRSTRSQDPSLRRVLLARTPTSNGRCCRCRPLRSPPPLSLLRACPMPLTHHFYHRPALTPIRAQLRAAMPAHPLVQSNFCPRCASHPNPRSFSFPRPM